MKKTGSIEIPLPDLRALLFWAAIGINGSNGGSYRWAPKLVKTLSEKIGFQLRNPRFITIKKL